MNDTDLATLRTLRDRILEAASRPGAEDDADSPAWRLLTDIHAVLADIVKRHDPDPIARLAATCAAEAARMGSPAVGRGLDDSEDADPGDYDSLDFILGRRATPAEARAFRDAFSRELKGRHKRPEASPDDRSWRLSTGGLDDSEPLGSGERQP